MSELENKIFEAVEAARFCESATKTINADLAAWINANYVKRDELRDQFAGQASCGMWGNIDICKAKVATIADYSYEAADAMLAAREKSGGK
jgi:hypothetical protein